MEEPCLLMNYVIIAEHGEGEFHYGLVAEKCTTDKE